MTDVQAEKPASTARRVRPWLWAGLVLLPIVFAWFTLRSGFRVWLRIAAFVWMVVSLPVLLFGLLLVASAFLDDPDTPHFNASYWKLATYEEGQFDDRHSLLILVEDGDVMLESAVEALRKGRDVSSKFDRVRVQLRFVQTSADDPEKFVPVGFKDAIELTWTPEDLARLDADASVDAINMARLEILRPSAGDSIGKWCMSEASEDAPAFCARYAVAEMESHMGPRPD